MTSATAVLLSLAIAAVSGGCPPRQRESWEHSKRALMMESYSKYNMRCPNVEVALFPERIIVEHGLKVARLDMGVLLEWTDPWLAVDSTGGCEGDTVVLNASEIWTPQLLSTSLDNALLTPTRVTAQTTTANSRTGRVSSFFQTTLMGMCLGYLTSRWPRDMMYCHFILQRPRTEHFNLTQLYSITQLDEMRKRWGGQPKPLERMSSWRVDRMESYSFDSPPLLVQASLQRLPAQLEAEIVHPMCLVSALVPASVALPPWSGERPTLLATAVVLHALLLMCLPYLTVDVGGDALPRNLTLYGDSGLLILVVVVQWLMSLRLASRKRALSGWARSVARGLATLRAPLLLPSVPSPAKQTLRRPFDEESVGLSEVLDRLTMLSVTAGYLVIVVVSLQ